jgi:hypothetical protein
MPEHDGISITQTFVIRIKKEDIVPGGHFQSAVPGPGGRTAAAPGQQTGLNIGVMPGKPVNYGQSSRIIRSVIGNNDFALIKYRQSEETGKGLKRKLPINWESMSNMFYFPKFLRSLVTKGLDTPDFC